jgi:hypothetical protein
MDQNLITALLIVHMGLLVLGTLVGIFLYVDHVLIQEPWEAGMIVLFICFIELTLIILVVIGIGFGLKKLNSNRGKFYRQLRIRYWKHKMKNEKEEDLSGFRKQEKNVELVQKN